VTTAGVLRLHDFELATSVVIPALAEHVDGLFILAHEAPRHLLDEAGRHPKCEKLEVYEGRWKSAVLHHEAFQLLNGAKPKYVIYIDEDEILPERFRSEFKRFQASGHDSVACYYLQCWNDIDHVVADHPYNVNRHCVALRWEEGITFLDYAGWDWPSAYYKRKKYTMQFPLRHLAFMTPELRQRRATRRAITSRADTMWYLEDHPSIPYDGNMTWKQYTEQAKKWKQ